MRFEPRTTSPSADNKFYLKAGKGGYNRAMEINKTTHSCLPNCCGEVHGRWLESQKQTDYNTYDKLCTGNAHSYWGKNDGYARGQVPKLGAIICYSKDGGAGHVAFVEKIYDNGDILSSNSGYNGSRFFTKKLTKSSGYSFGSKYHLQGFIYNPVEFTEENVTPTVERDESKDQLKVLAKSLRVRTDHNTSSGVLGYAKTDGIYDWYEMVHDGKYDWYRIAEGQWIANNGSYLEIYPKKGEDPEVIAELEKQVQELTDKNKVLEIKCANLEKENQELIDNNNSYKLIYKCPKTGKYKINIDLKKNEELYLK